MPRNRFGGKNAKKMANKKLKGAEDSQFHLAIPEDEDQYIGRIKKRLGDGRFLVEYVDVGVCEALARVPGAMRRISRNIHEGSYIIYQAWGLNENERKGSILHLYSEHETAILRQSGELAGIVDEVQQEENDEIMASEAIQTRVVDDDDDLLMIDEI